MTRNDEYDEELTADRAEIASILEGVADGVRAGDVRLGDGANAVSVAMPDELTLELELETEGGEASLELEIEWPASDAESSVTSIEEPIGVEEENEDETETGKPVLAGATDGPQSMARFELFQDRASEWRWRLRHRNGNVIATGGEGYTRKHNALKGIRSVVANSPDAELSEEFSE
ncbi:amphi-Trp domain-containing protein [Halolamina salina]|uniref:Amphi-Trp domain-containing protein n=1 Tax=Halolamina salina TaxID=1220023 RepID=A0ABD6B7T4_9EURY